MIIRLAVAVAVATVMLTIRVMSRSLKLVRLEVLTNADVEELGEEKPCQIQGVMIEDNLLKEYPKFHRTKGKKVLQIRPSIKWNKGHALEYLLEKLGFTSPTPKVKLMLYHSTSVMIKLMKDAFKVLKSRGAGFPIIVTSKPRETAASYSLRDPTQVLSFLIRMARWKSARFH